MIFIVLTILVFSLLQIVGVSMPILGVAIPFSVLGSAWIGYRFGPLLGFTSLVASGVVVSFFHINPLISLIAYFCSALIILIGVTATADDENSSFVGSIITTSFAAIVLQSMLMVLSLSNYGALVFSATIVSTFFLSAMTWVAINFIASLRS